jgi:pyruvate ferredoxin oxidoreductase alpha subunit
MPETVALEGNYAVAEAMRQIDPDVVAAYPITPSTEAVQVFSEYVANGKVHTEYVAVESEHSAMSACIGASQAGARVMNVTSSQGLALMWEMLYIAASTRSPIVLGVANRALSGNINIHCDHSDAMGARDAGWIQLWSENSQEVYDNLIQAIRIGERLDVSLPVMVNYDGFIISHAVETMQVEDDAAVRAFVGERKPLYSLLDVDHPITVGPLDFTDYYFEHKRQQLSVYPTAKQAVLEVGKEFGEAFGREYGWLEGYGLDDAELVVVALGSTIGTAKDVVDALRAEGNKVGLLKPRMFRPFPDKEIADALAHAKAIAVMDRSAIFGGVGGPLMHEVTQALYEHRPDKAPLVNYIYGLGGRDVTPDHIASVFRDLDQIRKTGDRGDLVRFVGVREPELAASFS